MITIDGSHGEGGGQILRSSLSLAMATGQPCRVTNVREGRKKPGLMRQHLTALSAAVEICGGEAEGASIGSQEVVFRPGNVKPGTYNFAVGTAGSATLVLQTILPALMIAEGPSKLRLEGGTHNPWSPPFDFLETTFLSVVGKMGPKMSARIHSHGFFPAGGGSFSLEVEPCTGLKEISLVDAPVEPELSCRAIVSSIPEAIAVREAKVLNRELGIPAEHLVTEAITDGHGPGNVAMVEVKSEQLTELFTGFGRKNVRAEKVAHELAHEVRSYLKARVPVGPHLADQLLLPMALAGSGEFRTQTPTLHTKTNIEVIKAFMDIDITVTEDDRGACAVEIRG